MNTKDFNAGTPQSSWLKEQLIGEIADQKNGFGSPLIKKYNITIDDSTEDLIMNIGKLDDLPDNLKEMATEIIKTKLDPGFCE